MSGARKQYLEAMGIQTWVRRAAAPATKAVSADMPKPAMAEAQAPDPRPLLPDAVESPPPPLESPQAMSGASPPIPELGWGELEAQVRDCTKCELHLGRTHTVFGVGAHDADWMIIGEGPGAEEDRKGEPFVGRAGKLLDNMLRALALERGAVYIANIVKCRPPGNRDPKPEEAAACRPYLERQIALVQPKLILAVGRIAAQNLLETDVPVGKLRGRVHHYGTARIPLVVTYHPAYLLRSPEQKARAWDDLCLARAFVEADA